MFEVTKRSTLLYPSGPKHDPNRKHLFVVLTDPFGPAKQVLIVSVVTMRGDKCDQSCVLKKEDHEFIEHDSFVAYATCRVEFESTLISGLSSREFVEKPKLREDVFVRVVGGMTKTKLIKPFAIQFFQESNCAKKTSKNRPQT